MCVVDLRAKQQRRKQRLSIINHALKKNVPGVIYAHALPVQTSVQKSTSLTNGSVNQAGSSLVHALM